MSPTNPKRKAFIVGLGGHCKSVIAMLESSGLYEVAGLYDTAESADLTEIKLGYPVLGTLRELLLQVQPATAGRQIAFEAPVVFLAIGDNQMRTHVFEQLFKVGIELPNLIASTAVVHSSVTLGCGNVIGHFCLLNAGATVGDNNIINSRSTLEHDVQLGSHCHVAPAATLCGNVKVANYCFVGTGAVVVPKVTLAERTTIGAGAVMIKQKNIPNSIYTGIPAKPLVNSKLRGT